MSSTAENNIPTRKTLWQEIREVNAMLERRIAQQMAIAWRIGQTEIGRSNPVLARASQASHQSGSAPQT